MSDRELDAAVAERVIGWTGVRRDTYDIRCPGITPEGALKLVPLYSTTGDGMLGVVEALCARGWRVDITEEKDLHLVRVMRTDDEKFYERAGLVEGTTLPRAVCMAALRAVGALKGPS